MNEVKDFNEYAKSSAALKKNWLENMKKRFSDAGKEIEPSDLNTGIIGFAFDMMGNETEDAFFTTNTKAREIFPTVARLTDSVYTHATMVNITDFYAQPAYIDLLLGIPKSQIIESAIDFHETTGSVSKKLTISGETEITLDTHKYLIAYPVDIYYKKMMKSSGEYADYITASYQTEYIFKSPFTDIKTAYIQSLMQNINGEEYFVFKVRAYQLVKDMQNFKFLQSSIESDTFTVPYNGQLASFDVFYRDNSKSKYKKIKKLYSGTLQGAVNDAVFCYYRLRDGEYDITFSNNPAHVLPKFNSDIKIITYVTEGDDGNFEYSESDIKVKLHQNMDDKYQEALSGIFIKPQLLFTKSSGGKNKLSLEDLRNLIVEQKSSRLTITSTPDLIRIFNRKNIFIQRTRDDFYRREFMTYILLENKDTGYIIPSRTVTIDVQEDELITNLDDKPQSIEKFPSMYILPPGTVYRPGYDKDYDSKNTNSYPKYIHRSLDYYVKDELTTNLLSDMKDRPNEKKYDIKSFTADIRSKLYDLYNHYDGVLMTTPFLLKIFRNPYFVGVYDITCNEDKGLTFDWSNPMCSEKFSINSINIVRHNIWDDFYEITCKVAVSSAVYSIIDASNGGYDIMRVRLELIPNIDKDTRLKKDCIYVDLNLADETSDGELIFKGVLKDTKYYSDRDLLQIDNKYDCEFASKIINTKTLLPTARFNETEWLPFTAEVKVGILYRAGNRINSEEYDYFRHRLDKDEWCIADVFATNKVVKFVNDISDTFAVDFDVSLIEHPAVLRTEPEYMTYSTNVYEYIEVPDPNDPSKTIQKIKKDSNGKPIIKHHVGEKIPKYKIVNGVKTIEKDLQGNIMYEILHDIGTPLHNPDGSVVRVKDGYKNNFVFKNIPMVSIYSLLHDNLKYLIYKTFRDINSTLHTDILPYLVENNTIRVGVYNTIGKSKMFLHINYRGNGITDNLKNLSLSIELNVKLKNNDNEETLKKDITESTRKYIKQVMDKRLFYMDDCLNMLKSKYPDIEYVEFSGLYGESAEKQTIRINPEIDDKLVIPEYIIVRQVIDKNKFINNGQIHFIDDINIRII